MLESMSESQKRESHLLVSPIEPSGITWLINCLLELNLACYPGDSFHKVWKQGAGHSYSLRQDFFYLKQWLPVLSNKIEFTFAPDILFEWTHDFPKMHHSKRQTVFMIRDPRISFNSRFLREKESFPSYDAFLNYFDSRLLIKNTERAFLFYDTWKLFANPMFLRFEDYKRDPISTLESVLNYYNLSFGKDAIEQAVSESTFEKAKVGEDKYRASLNIMTPRQIHSGSTFISTNKTGKQNVENSLIEKALCKILEEQYDFRCPHDFHSKVIIRNDAFMANLPISSSFRRGCNVSDFEFLSSLSRRPFSLIQFARNHTESSSRFLIFMQSIASLDGLPRRSLLMVKIISLMFRISNRFSIKPPRA
jgi:Sulfotransferase domain